MAEQKRKLGYVVELYMPDADPSGVRVIEKMNWSGQGIAIPRSSFIREKSRPELNRPGVYVLVGRDEESNSPMLYIGEGDPIIERLSGHFSSKSYWTELVAFTSKDGTLNKAHIQYLESRLVHLADVAKRCKLDNAQRPTEPTMSEAIKAVAEGYLQDLLLCMPLLNIACFEPAPEATLVVEYFEISGKGVKAKGFESTQGFVVVKDSEIAKDEAASVPTHIHAKREDLRTRGIMVDKGAHYSLVDNYTFDSPSMAASVVLGNSTNGRFYWKNKDNVSLGDVEKIGVEKFFNDYNARGVIKPGDLIEIDPAVNHKA